MVIGIGHLALLLILNADTSKVAPGGQVEPSRPDFVVRIGQPSPAKLRPKPRRDGQPAPPPPAKVARPTPEPVQQARTTAAAAPFQAPPQAVPGPPDYGRWTAAPASAGAQGPALGLAGCTPATLPTLTGAARDACARRLAEIAKNARALPPAGAPRNVQEQAYADAVRAWKGSPDMTPHPCPQQDEPAHKLFLDKCSLMNASRETKSRRAAVRVEFKIRF